jgi:hypothetical protein
VGIRLIIGDGTGDSDRVALYDSVSGWAFGPIFTCEEDAEAFLEFAKTKDDRDLRRLTDNELAEIHSQFIDQREPASF